eukprot:2167474-Prymnesium_polylepis.1
MLHDPSVKKIINLAFDDDETYERVCPSTPSRSSRPNSAAPTARSARPSSARSSAWSTASPASSRTVSRPHSARLQARLWEREVATWSSRPSSNWWLRSGVPPRQQESSRGSGTSFEAGAVGRPTDSSVVRNAS